MMLSATSLTPTETLPVFEGWTGNVNDVAIDQSGNMHVIAEFNDYAYLETEQGQTELNTYDTDDYDTIVAQFDASGTLQWYQQIGGPGRDRGYSIGLDDAGNVYATGYFSGEATFGTNTLQAEQSSDLFATKLDPDGNFQWAVTSSDLGIDASDQERGSDIAFDDATSSVVLVGSSDRGFVMQLDPASGNSQRSLFFGGGKWDTSIIRALDIDSGGDLYLTGDFTGNLDIGGITLQAGKAKGGDVNTDVFAARLASTLDVVWAQSVIGEGSTNDYLGPVDYGYGIALGAHGSSESVYLTGYSYSETLGFGDGVVLDSGAYLAQLSRDGNVRWAKGFDAFGFDVAADDSGKVLVVGEFVDTVDFDPESSSDSVLTASGPRDGYVAQFDASATFVNAWQMGGSHDLQLDEATEVEFDDAGQAHVSGNVLAPATFPTGTLVADNPKSVEGEDVIGFVMTLASSESHDVAVTGLTAPSVIVQGDSETIDVAVENQGTNDETFDVMLTSDNGTPNDVDDDFTIGSCTGVVLASGTSATLTASWDTTSTDLADHTLTAEAILGTDEDTADNTATATVRVEEERHDVAVTELTAPSPVVEGDVVNIGTTVENQGNREETFDVTLVSDNGTADTADDFSIGTWSSVTLDANDSQVLTTSWDTTEVNTADHTLRATATTVTGETDTADNELTATVTVDSAPSGSTSDMYVSDIYFESQARGKKHTDYRVVVDIRNDSDADGEGELSDDSLAGVQVAVVFAGKTYTGLTDENGVFRTDWVNNLGSGDHQAEVTDLALTDFFWNPDLDLQSDSDGDGLPDHLLTI